MKITPHPEKTFGATITNIKVSNITTSQFQQIEDAFNQYGLLIFKNQHLSMSEQTEFGKRFGEIEHLVQGRPEMESVNIANSGGKANKLLFESSMKPNTSRHFATLLGNEVWHTDSTYTPVSSKCALLQAMELPSTGGETEFADARAAYDDLDADMKRKIEHLNAYHSLHYSMANDESIFPKVGDAYGYDGKAYLRPLVKIHPATKRPNLHIGRHAHNIVGLSREESVRLIDDLNAFTGSKAEYVIRHKYSVGDLVLWDNRRLLHRACPYDYYNEKRVLQATRIKGESSERYLEHLQEAKLSEAVLAQELKILRHLHQENVFSIEPLACKTFGAKIRGVDLANLSEGDFEKINQAFVEYGLLIFPKIGLDPETQEKFASRFGKLRFNGTPMGNYVDEYKKGEIFALDKTGMKINVGNEQWHFDDTYQPQSATGGLLTCEVMTSWGGGTGFLDARAAYDTLPEELKNEIKDLKAWHSNEFSQAMDVGWIPPRGLIPIYHGKAYLRPLIKIHPKSNRKTLYVGRHAFGVEGYSRERSFELLEKLNSHCRENEERMYIHNYRRGDLVLFDNRCIMHKACEYDYSNEKRKLVGSRILGTVETESSIQGVDENGRIALENELNAIRQDMEQGIFRPRLQTYQNAVEKLISQKKNGRVIASL